MTRRKGSIPTLDSWASNLALEWKSELHILIHPIILADVNAGNLFLPKMLVESFRNNILIADQKHAIPDLAPQSHIGSPMLSSDWLQRYRNCQVFPTTSLLGSRKTVSSVEIYEDSKKCLLPWHPKLGEQVDIASVETEVFAGQSST